MARELDDAILNLRTNYLDYGVWVLKTRGAAVDVLETDAGDVCHDVRVTFWSPVGRSTSRPSSARSFRRR